MYSTFLRHISILISLNADSNLVIHELDSARLADLPIVKFSFRRYIQSVIIIGTILLWFQDSQNHQISGKH